jgi:serine/threonine-protein kinase
MGDIYVATDEVLGRDVAVKLLAERYAADTGIRQRFKREGLAAARISGEPGALTIFDVGEWEDRPFIVMEYVSGGSLEERIRSEGAQPSERALAWLEQAATRSTPRTGTGSSTATSSRRTCFSNDRGEVRVADFGIASAAGLDSMTLTGTVLGTAGYLSPEQAMGERAAPASDLYALAVVAYELLSGERPFESDSPTPRRCARQRAGAVDRGALREPAAGARPVFQRALAKDPSGVRLRARVRGRAARRARRSAATTRCRRLAARPAQRSHRYLVPLALLLAAARSGAIVAAI